MAWMESFKQTWEEWMRQLGPWFDELTRRGAEWLTLILQRLTELLGQWGVPEEYRQAAALGGLYLGVTVVLLIFVLLLVRLRRPKRPRPEPAKPPAEKAEAEVEAPAEAAAEAVPPKPAPEPVVEAPVSLFDRMRTGLAKTSSSLMGRIDGLLSGKAIVDDELLEDLEEILITADFGMQTTNDLMQSLQKRFARGETPTSDSLRTVLKEEIRLRLRQESDALDLERAKPFVIMVVGVNGVGKTTTIGKLAHQFTSAGKKVVLGAADTFRAAAADQLEIWGERAGVDVVRHAEGADPGAVTFDAVKAAVARKADVLLLDTAGRLHTKVNLMEEMKKLRRILDREIPGAPHEVMLVLDATTGQNALVQARMFKDAVEVSGLALTKLDGTAKGGMVVAIGRELALPVRYVGIGEKIEDLRPFDPDLFVDALFQRS